MQKLVIALALLTAVNRGLGQQYTPVPADAYQSNADHLNAAKKQAPAKDNSQAQILLRLRVYEVSRTKLRNLGFDFARNLGFDFARVATETAQAPAQAESLVKVLDALRRGGRRLPRVGANVGDRKQSARLGQSRRRSSCRRGFGSRKIRN